MSAVHESSTEDMREVIERAHASFLEWRTVPAPKRGELVRLLGEELRRQKTALGRLISIEVGKILSEGEGEVLKGKCDPSTSMVRKLRDRFHISADLLISPLRRRGLAA
jgi:aldehyde dehydrogenase (NAD+)